MLRDKLLKILNEYDSQTGFGIDGATDDLEALFNSNLKEEREGIIREVEDFIIPMEFPENVDERVIIGRRNYNRAIDMIIEKLATNTLEVKL